MGEMQTLVGRARTGDVDAFADLVRATQRMAHAVAWKVVRDEGLAEDVAQQAYLTAFRRLGDLDDADAFPGWLRRIVVNTALNERRRTREAFLQLELVPEVPVLDEAEVTWTDQQRRHLAAALVRLTDDERAVCERRYHGRWSTARLAAAAGIDEPTMRKRLQRLRDRLRMEIETMEQQAAPSTGDPHLPERIVDLLARPRLTALPENPVGRVLELLRTAFPGFVDQAVPEMIDIEAARGIVTDAMYVDPSELHRVDTRSILRYDLTLPLLLTVRYGGAPLRVWASGKAYRVCQADALHLEAFHQAEAMWMDERSRLDVWQMTARVMQSIDAALPGRAVKVVPTRYPMCAQAWELEVEDQGNWSEVLAWGVFSDSVVSHLGGDPARHTAVGVGYGLERVAMLRYGIGDIRHVESVTVA